MDLKLMKSHGQHAIGFVDIFELDNYKKATCIVNYLPMFNELYRHVHVTILIEGKSGDWTDCEVKELLNDICDYVKEKENDKFKYGNKLSYINTQMFYIDKIKNFELLNHGDFAF